MKSNKLIVTALMAGGMLSGAPLLAQPKAVDVQSAWKAYSLPRATDYSVFFNPAGPGSQPSHSLGIRHRLEQS